MANETNEISDIVKKCKILLLDIEGTTTSISFVKDKLFPYAEEHVKEFLDTQWESDDVKEAVTALRKLALEDQEKSVEGVVSIPGEDASKEDQIKALVESVKWQMSQDRKVGALKQLQGLIWKQGYDKGDIKGHVYDDVSPALRLWRSVDGHQVYIYSSGSVQAQKLLFAQSLAGDMLPLIDGHFDTAVGAKQEAASYTAIAEKIGCKPEEILFLTDIVKEGEAARASGIQVALMSREGNAPLPAEATSAYPVLHSFEQLTTTNKRKPPTQDEQPAKVPKTDTEADVKTAVENATPPEKNRKTEELEKMDVEESNDKVDQTEKVAATITETVVEEVTDSSKVVDTPVCDTEPIVEESVEKSNEDTVMETEPIEVSSNATSTKENAKIEEKEEIKVPLAEATPTVITEIEELTDDTQTLSEVAEIIENLEPVVEEPPVIDDIDDLRNVSEVLGKECDEILSKVQDVTNLDNLPLKPLLKTIAEETMETENADSNDIVDRILDTEMELGMKPCEGIEGNKVEEIKTLIEEGENIQKEETITEDKISDDKQAEINTTEPETILDKNEKNSSAEVNTDVKVDVNEANVKSVENKMEVEESKEQIVENKADIVVECSKETADSVEDKDSNKVVESNLDVESKTDTIENKTKEIEKTTEAVANKTEIAENKMEVVANETKVESKEEVIESTMEVEDKKVSNKEIESHTPATETEKSAKVSSVIEVTTETKESPVTEVAAETKESPVIEVTSETKESPVTVVTEETKESLVTEVTEETKESPVTEVTAETKESLITEVTAETKEIPAKEASTEKKENVSVPEEVKGESEVTDTQMNGKTTNGDADAGNLNGDACKDDELSSRLSVENGKEEVNGSNGDSNEATQKQDDNKMETEIADIKVKSVATEEPRGDPIEQPTEA